jgi:hypothetical protein
MSTAVVERLRRAFEPGPRGALGLADELLEAARCGAMRCEWEGGTVRVTPAGAEPFDVALPKSAFRAVLARLAALCNERRAGSVTPYRGSAEVLVGAPPVPVLVAFVNTPDDLHLDARPAPAEVPAPAVPHANGLAAPATA